jgi:Lsr2
LRLLTVLREPAPSDAEYEIDLAKGNAKRLQDVFEAVRGSGPQRKWPGRRRGRRGAGGPRDANQTKAIRAWARQTGIQVSDRGRIPDEVEEAYNKRTDRFPSKAAVTNDVYGGSCLPRVHFSQPAFDVDVQLVPYCAFPPDKVQCLFRRIGQRRCYPVECFAPAQSLCVIRGVQ